MKGSLNTQFGFFAPDRRVGAKGCGAGLVASVGKRGGRSQWIGAWRGCAAARSAERANKRVQGERSERALAVFGLLGPLAVLSNAAAAGSGRALV